MGGYRIAVIPTNFTRVSAQDLEIDSGTLSVDAANNRVGMGTTVPLAQLHLASSYEGGGLGMIHVVSDGSEGGAITFELDGASKFKIAVGANGDLSFYDETGGASRLVIEHVTGNIGIGTVDPNAKLTVEGAVTLKEQAAADGDTAAYGQLWVKTATPNQLYYTTDAGDDIQLTSGTAIVGGGMTSFILEDGDGTEVSVSDAEEVKFVEGTTSLDINWTDTTPGSDGDPFDLTFTIIEADASLILHGQVFS